MTGNGPVANNDSEGESLEVLAPSAIQTLERAAIDSQVATAHAYPRSLAKFQRKALEMATLDPETAESCIYIRPVGKEQNEKGQWVEKFAEGPSIRAAEIVASQYGNLRVASRVIEQTERFVRCEGVCHDLESNYAAKSEVVEATVKKSGEPYSERQRALVAKVCLAKAYRDAIFKVVPRAIFKPIIDAAKKVASGAALPIDQRRKKVQAWVTQTLKIDEARVFAVLNVQGWVEVTEAHLTTLTGLKTGIGDGEVKIDEAFPPLENKAPTGNQPPTKPEATGKPVNAPTNVVPLKKEETKKTEPVSATANQAQQPAEAEQKQAGEVSPAPTQTTPPASVQQEATTAAPAANANVKIEELSAEDCVTIITGNAKAAGISLEALHALLKKKKVMKDTHTQLSEIATVRLQSVVKNWAQIAAELLPKTEAPKPTEGEVTP